jgi:hypothetical protein
MFLDIIYCLVLFKTPCVSTLVLSLTHVEYFNVLSYLSQMTCAVLDLYTLSCVGAGTSSTDWAQLSRFYLKMETEWSLRNAVF